MKNTAIAAEIAKSKSTDSVEIDEVEEIQQSSDEKHHVLTLKEERFCQEYLVDLNATQVAIRAGYTGDTIRRRPLINF
ncbi:terminase small subunit [Chitinophaga sancti]|uniref:Terminase small subunit n=1 Tax=Chitinophaga sancti TaxID=1004 RepID=A0ABZ0XMI1_9BACT|nr:terminase small subunit [Chitinophaga sancti]WQD62666.1 terminase small subunit [Chitinophaga sancti]WQG91710.1 terminase small subunit [Chitinophaga sancti]